MVRKTLIENALFKRSFDRIAKIGRRRSIRRVESFKSVVSASKTASFCEIYDRLKLTSLKTVVGWSFDPRSTDGRIVVKPW